MGKRANKNLDKPKDNPELPEEISDSEVRKEDAHTEKEDGKKVQSESAESRTESAESKTESAESETESAKPAAESAKPEEPAEKKKRRFPIWARILVIAAAAVIVVAGGGYAAFHYLYNRMNIVTDAQDVLPQEEIFDEDEDIEDLKPMDPDNIQLDSAREVESEDVINILLCGEEAINDDRGRTDSIMIATINCKDNALRLTSIMRDTYVSIPGFRDNKINAAYHNGGMETLVETVKENFGITVDGYVLVNFESFEELIDAVGGIDIELSSAEASYLNRTNYVSNYAYHNLVAGVNHMNGNQALGYARVRYVSKDGLSGDFARTLRHRTVMEAIYNQLMDKSALELVAMLPTILPMLTTNIKESDLIDYLMELISIRNKNTEIETLNVPIDGYYTMSRVGNMSVVLASPMDVNVQKMQEFIFGSALTQDSEQMKEGANISVGQ